MIVNGHGFTYETMSQVPHAAPLLLLSAKNQALRVAELIEGISPLIEEHTALVCPSCEDVCCISRHCVYTDTDMLFISILGESFSAISDDLDSSDPCRFLGSGGCSLKRYLRPYRCTWFFCEPLLESIGNRSARYYRRFVRSLNRITQARQDLFQSISDNGILF